MKDKYINGSLYYLDFRCVSVFVCVCVCVCVCVVEVVKNIFSPMPPIRGNTVPYLPKIYEKPRT